MRPEFAWGTPKSNAHGRALRLPGVGLYAAGSRGFGGMARRQTKVRREMRGCVKIGGCGESGRRVDNLVTWERFPSVLNYRYDDWCTKTCD
ncbi:hypothetical protein CLOM_g9688 [Closterium sp. NIES-68]|nr:hypothetical protein CLOM_g9688 [Closterium sp. NIES-68]GJP58537.1 hypothetical protein CLOP_g392 [Closterium sp. NIES-67]